MGASRAPAPAPLSARDPAEPPAGHRAGLDGLIPTAGPAASWRESQVVAAIQQAPAQRPVDHRQRVQTLRKSPSQATPPGRRWGTAPGGGSGACLRRKATSVPSTCTTGSEKPQPLDRLADPHPGHGAVEIMPDQPAAGCGCRRTPCGCHCERVPVVAAVDKGEVERGQTAEVIRHRVGRDEDGLVCRAEVRQRTGLARRGAAPRPATRPRRARRCSCPAARSRVKTRASSDVHRVRVAVTCPSAVPTSSTRRGRAWADERQHGPRVGLPGYIRTAPRRYRGCRSGPRTPRG